MIQRAKGRSVHERRGASHDNINQNGVEKRKRKAWLFRKLLAARVQVSFKLAHTQHFQEQPSYEKEMKAQIDWGRNKCVALRFILLSSCFSLPSPLHFLSVVNTYTSKASDFLSCLCNIWRPEQAVGFVLLLISKRKKPCSFITSHTLAHFKRHVSPTIDKLRSFVVLACVANIIALIFHNFHPSPPSSPLLSGADCSKTLYSNGE